MTPSGAGSSALRKLTKLIQKNNMWSGKRNEASRNKADPDPSPLINDGPLNEINASRVAHRAFWANYADIANHGAGKRRESAIFYGTSALIDLSDMKLS